MQKNPYMIFKGQKEACLSGVDLSRKGSVDAPIQTLVTWINQCDNYVTTSSCSGRIAVFSYPDGEVQKKGCDWLYMSHDDCDAHKVWAAVSGCQGDAFFKFEAFVLHVQCATIADAQKMLSCAVASGNRNSGISISNKGKIVTAVRSTHGLEVPLTHRGQTLVSHQYIEHLVGIANVKMRDNLHRINRFFDNLKSSLTQDQTTEEDHMTRVSSKKHRRRKGKTYFVDASLENKQQGSSVNNWEKSQSINSSGKNLNIAKLSSGLVDNLGISKLEASSVDTLDITVINSQSVDNSSPGHVNDRSINQLELSEILSSSVSDVSDVKLNCDDESESLVGLSCFTDVSELNS